MNNNGLTIIELLIVVAIFGIIATVATITMQGPLNMYKVKGAARQIYGDLQMARMKAIKEGSEWAVEFSGNTYTVRNAGANGTWNDADDTVIKTVDIESEYKWVTITSAPTRDIFSPDGTASFQGAMNGTVTVSRGTESQSICINTGTGNVRIC